MLYNTENCRVRDFRHVDHLVLQKLENTAFRKLDLFTSSGEGETPSLLGPLRLRLVEVSD
jgi:hypothetical protein